MSRYLIILQRDKCIGCGACSEAAPARWRMSKSDGKSILVSSVPKKKLHMLTIHESELQENMLAMKSCPVKVISIQRSAKIKTQHN